MATLKQKASRYADKGLDKADETVSRLRGAKRQAEDNFDEAESRFDGMVEETGRTLRRAYDNGLDRLEDTAGEAERVIKRNPLLAVAGAFVGGMLASMFMRR